MMDVAINLVFEDRLSKAVMERLCVYAAKDFDINYRINLRSHCKGFGKIKSNAEKYNCASKNLTSQHIYFFILTDLDRNRCAPKLIDDWLETEKSNNLVFRVAVEEVESWLIADCDNLRQQIRVSKNYALTNSDQIANPKEWLLDMARHSRSKLIREDMLPLPGAKIGPDYNNVLIEFVWNRWAVDRAMAVSESLRETVKALQRVLSDENVSDEKPLSFDKSPLRHL